MTRIRAIKSIVLVTITVLSFTYCDSTEEILPQETEVDDQTEEEETENSENGNETDSTMETVDVVALKSEAFLNLANSENLIVNGNPEIIENEEGVSGFIFNQTPLMSLCNENSDFIQIDSLGNIFENGFSISVEASFNSIGSFQRIIDFGNGIGEEGGFNIVLSRLDTTRSLVLSHWVDTLQSNVQGVVAANVIEENVLTTFAASISGDGQMKVYVNGELINSRTGLPLTNISRNMNFIGRSNWCFRDDDFSGVIQNLFVFNRELDEEEVRALHSSQ